MKFSLVEFVVVCRLELVSSLERPNFDKEHYRLIRTYFLHDATVKMFSLIEAIKVKCQNNVEDAIKLVILYVIHKFINTTRLKQR